MRKQYHFRPSERGLQAWDVDRLVALSKDLPRFRIELTAIFELDEAYWFSGGAREATCRAVIEHARFIAEADLSFPIILSSDGRVMDGMHRVGKALLNGKWISKPFDLSAIRSRITSGSTQSNCLTMRMGPGHREHRTRSYAIVGIGSLLRARADLLRHRHGIEVVTRVAAVIAGLGALVGFFHLLTTRRCQSYHNYKTELELLRQPTDSPNLDPDFERFLVNVRKEKISFVASGMPIPNAELDREGCLSHNASPSGKKNPRRRHKDRISGLLNMPR
jgi:hypothetical protein